mmetsp:Transcript_38674/g.98908  ORF Transcript_38674/g.98908 Transcript_38674/m.98908 type:complete len:470 (+) Transcript_38674:123-1532(+)
MARLLSVGCRRAALAPLLKLTAVVLAVAVGSPLRVCSGALVPPSHHRDRHKHDRSDSAPTDLGAALIGGHTDVSFEREGTLGGFSHGVPLSDSLVALGTWLDARQRGDTLRYDRMGPVGFWLLEQVQPPPALLGEAQPWWGKVFGSPASPSIERFVSAGDPELPQLCADRRRPLPVERLPLRLPAHIYQSLFLTQETCNHRSLASGLWEVVDPLGPEWDQICPALEPRMASVMPSQTRHASCAVVGNAGNLAWSRYGAEIDRHEAVFRLNKAPTTGFEEQVGTNTTYRYMNGDQFSVYAAEGWDSETGEMQRLPVHMGGIIIVSYSSPATMAKELPRVREHHPDEKLTTASYYLHRYTNFVLNQFRQCANMRNEGRSFSRTKATSGIKALLAALHMCKHVSVYGIGDTSPAAAAMPYQYFAMGDGNWTSRGMVSELHSLTLEEQLLQALAHAGLIRHCQLSGCTHPLKT